MEKINIIKQLNPDKDVLHAISSITLSDVYIWFKQFVSNKERLSKPKVGLMFINDIYYPQLKGESLAEWEKTKYVFFAVGKRRISLFKREARVFVWHPLSEDIYIVPKEVLSFELLEEKASETCFISSEPEKGGRVVNANGQDHQLMQSKELYREFDVMPEKMVVKRDIVKYQYHWTNPDKWVFPKTVKINYAPMSFLRKGAPDLWRDYPRYARPSLGYIEE